MQALAHLHELTVLTIIVLVLSSSLHPVASSATASPDRPHVVIFVIDDLGWADVGYRNGSDVSTPFLDELAETGIILDSYYTQPVCSPSRAALMQGMFPFKTGLQHFNTIMPGSLAALPLSQPTLAEIFENEGYYTSAVGKWHLGYATWNNTPTQRGFKSHQGYFQGEIDYYTKKFQVPKQFLPIVNITGLDWWRNKTAVRDEEGVYNGLLFDEEMRSVLKRYNLSSTPSSLSVSPSPPPLFMYYAHQLVHVPLETPTFPYSSQYASSKYHAQGMEKCANITDPKRNKYCQMLLSVDDSLAQLVMGLKDAGMWNDTLLIITTDNGAMVDTPLAFPPSAGVNYPLRAGKGTTFEGGVRGVCVVQGGANVLPTNTRGRTVSGQLFHMVDWFTTLATLSGAEDLPENVDGLDIWPFLMGTNTTTTTTTTTTNSTTSTSSISTSNVVQPLRTALPLNINWNISFPNKGYQVALVTHDGWKLILQNISGPVLTYDGWYPAPPASVIPPPPNPTPGKFLFNIQDDPSEMHNLYEQEENGKVQELNQLLEGFMESYSPPQHNMLHFKSIPWFHEGTWAPFA